MDNEIKELQKIVERALETIQELENRVSEAEAEIDFLKFRDKDPYI